MAATTELIAWKGFLRGRIAQERGDNKEALECFESALEVDPRNSFFLNAKSAALRALDRPDDAAVARVTTRYGELAKDLVGGKDKPGPWIKGLEEILDEVKRLEEDVESVTVVW